MIQIYSCIVHKHNLALVLVACVICLLASFTAFSAFDRALYATSSRRRMFVCIAALVAGLGIWATHFIAMLAYEPGFPVTYNVPRTLLSILAAIFFAGLGWIVALDRRPTMAALGGVIIGGGVGGMHYLGMSALQIPGIVVWDRKLIGVSILLGVGLATASIWVHRRKHRDPSWAAGVLLALGICTLHFIGMSAEIIYPFRFSSEAPQSVDSSTLAIVVTAATLLIFAVGIGLMVLDRQRSQEQLAEAQGRAALADEILCGAAEREELTAKLKRQAEISGAALDNMAQGLSMYDANDGLVIHNRRFAELYGLPEGMLAAGTPFSEICNYLVTTGLLSQSFPTGVPMESARKPLFRNREVRLLNGCVIEIKIRPLPAGGWVTTHEDVTEVHLANRQIAHLVAHDTLTGLPNRVAFAAELNAATRRGKGFAVHTIGLDRFKEVNDTLGYPVGDNILMETGARLRELVRQGEMVTRLGGDEFAVIQLDVTDPHAPAALADRIVERLAGPFEFAGHTVVMSASVGISLAPQDGKDGEELLKMSDLALYSAKQESCGTYRFFQRGMDSRLCERRQLETDLRAAIQEGQFEVHYQPLLNLITGRISSFEALVRWRHPTRGLVQPLDFIATAEDNGLIIPIGEWVLRQACRDAVQWPSDVGVAVNLSPVQFKRGDLIAMTVSALTAAALDPTRLELEITESILLHDEIWVRSTLNQLRTLGVRIAMDDFGTGYSSLSYLRSLPFHKIKIDRSFISDMVRSPDALSIVQATIHLSQKLGMEVTAEGVESIEQMQILATEGCTHAQGYHISQPVPGAQVMALLGVYNPDATTQAASARA